MKVYVAGPYTSTSTAHVLNNVISAMEAGAELLRMGFAPYIPHLYYFLEEHCKHNKLEGGFSYDEYIKLDIQWLRMCDALVCLGKKRDDGATSPGVALELLLARELNIPVFSSVQQLLECVRVDWRKGK
jgi:hypothetical protein